MFQPPVQWNLLHLQTTAVAWIDHAMSSDHYADRSEDGYLYSFRLNLLYDGVFRLSFFYKPVCQKEAGNPRQQIQSNKKADDEVIA